MVNKARIVKDKKRLNRSLQKKQDPNWKKAPKKQATKPKDKWKTRAINRCEITGRIGGYMRDFGLSRITFREAADRGEIPGVRKSSW